jgi:flagellar hook-length control protein FliK
MAEAARPIDSMVPYRQPAAPRRADADPARAGEDFATLIGEPLSRRTPHERIEKDHRREERRPDATRRERSAREEPRTERAAARDDSGNELRPASAGPQSGEARAEPSAKDEAGKTDGKPADGLHTEAATAAGIVPDAAPIAVAPPLEIAVSILALSGTGQEVQVPTVEAPAVAGSATPTVEAAQIQGAAIPEVGSQPIRTTAAVSIPPQTSAVATWSPIAAAEAATVEKQPAAGNPAVATGREGPAAADHPRVASETSGQPAQAQGPTRTAFAEFSQTVQAESRPVAAPEVAGPMAARETASSSAPQPQARHGTEPPVPLPALALEIGMRTVRGAREFSIALDPEELGRVEVKLRIDDEGAVKADLRVERVETLQLLQRDARTLERAFEQAGLKSGGDMLQFSLQGGERQAGGQERQNGGGNARALPDLDEALAPELIAHHVRQNAGSLDIRI